MQLFKIMTIMWPARAGARSRVLCAARVRGRSRAQATRAAAAGVPPQHPPPPAPRGLPAGTHVRTKGSCSDREASADSVGAHWLCAVEMGDEATYTPEDVAEHDGKGGNDLWLIVHGGVSVSAACSEPPWRC